MIRWFAGHPTAANILMLVFVLLGLSALPDLKRATFPDQELYEVEVSVPYPGASAQDVESAICTRLEDATESISFTEERRCEAKDNIGIMVLKMLEAGDIVQFLADIKTEVDAINDFPSNTETAVVRELGRTHEVVSVALSADIPAPDLKDLAEDIKRRMLRDPAIALIEIEGFSDRQLRIEIADYSLRQYGLSMADIAQRIGHQGIDLPSGTLETERRDFQVRFADERRSVEELKDLIIIQGASNGGAELRLGDIATITDTFDLKEQQILFNGERTALLKVKKNKDDDSIDALVAVESFLIAERARQPEGVTLALTQDFTTLIYERLNMIITNGWQGLLIVFFTLMLFFSWRYSFWVVMGLPVSFLGGLWIMALTGQSLNMLSMMGLLLAIGLLMDDAIVISESIAAHLKKGESTTAAAINGTQLVLRGVFSSFITTILILQGMLAMEGQMGQFLNDVPIVLLIVMAISLIEAFLILPHHLATAMEKSAAEEKPQWRINFERWFEQQRDKTTRLAEQCVRWRYPFIGGLLALFFITITLPASGLLKFNGLPDLDGDVLQARLIMPQGTPLARTEAVVNRLQESLQNAAEQLSMQESAPLIKNVTVLMGQNGDAFERGPHLATVSVDLLTAEARNTTLDQLSSAWREETGDVSGVIAMQFKEPSLGPSGRPLHIRLYHDDLDSLSSAAGELRQWLGAYTGVVDVLDDLRPGKPELRIRLKEGALSLGIEASTIAQQLRAAYHGSTAYEIQIGSQAYDIHVQLNAQSRDSLGDFDNFPIINPKNGQVIPLSNLAHISEERDYSRIHRVNGQRSVSIFGEIQAQHANVNDIVGDLTRHFLPELMHRYPSMRYSLEGEQKNIGTTGKSMVQGFIIGLIGVFLLLSLQFRNYREPLIVLLTIPLAMIGVIWGHLLMGYNLSMPSMIGFLSLAGVVVNDSILLVEFVKLHARNGVPVHTAAIQASRDRFRAVVLTSVTTLAGVLPLLLESSLQAQIIKPVIISIAFGMLSSTVLVLLVIPAAYAILEDFGFFKADIQHNT